MSVGRHILPKHPCRSFRVCGCGICSTVYTNDRTIDAPVHSTRMAHFDSQNVNVSRWRAGNHWLDGVYGVLCTHAGTCPQRIPGLVLRVMPGVRHSPQLCQSTSRRTRATSSLPGGPGRRPPASHHAACAAPRHGRVLPLRRRLQRRGA